MRLRRPRWKDPRLIVGIVLVLASVLMGSLLVSRLSETTPVLVTRSPLAPGDPIRPESLSAVEIRLGEQVGAYVGSIDAIPDRSEEHTSELQSRGHLVCRLLLEKKKDNK